MGFIKDPPPPFKRCVSTPGEQAHLRPGLPNPDTFRSRRFARPQRVTPRGTVQVCCTLQPAMGFAAFPARPARKQTARSPTAPHPPKLSPPCQLRHRHHHRSGVHQCLIPYRRCSWAPGTSAPCCHDLEKPFLRSLDLRVLSCHRVRCETAVLPPPPARGSLGLSSRINPSDANALPAWRPRRVLPKESPKKSSREPPRRVARGRPPPKGGGCRSEERQRSSRMPAGAEALWVSALDMTQCCPARRLDRTRLTNRRRPRGGDASAVSASGVPVASSRRMRPPPGVRPPRGVAAQPVPAETGAGPAPASKCLS